MRKKLTAKKNNRGGYSKISDASYHDVQRLDKSLSIYTGLPCRMSLLWLCSLYGSFSESTGLVGVGVGAGTSNERKSNANFVHFI